MTEAFALPAAPERAKLDAKRLEHAAHLTLEFLTDADQSITRAEKRSQTRLAVRSMTVLQVETVPRFSGE